MDTQMKSGKIYIYTIQHNLLRSIKDEQCLLEALLDAFIGIPCHVIRGCEFSDEFVDRHHHGDNIGGINLLDG